MNREDPDAAKVVKGAKRSALRFGLHPAATVLLVANLVLIWTLPVLPAQDLPEHLAYVRIFADYAKADLPFHTFYSLPERFQPYDSVYLALAWIARHSSVLFAIRLAVSAYATLLFVAVKRLAEASRDERAGEHPPFVTGVLASVLVWSPVVAMGFLQYFLCVPLVLLTVASLLRWSDDETATTSAWGVVFGSALVASVHLAAAGALALFAVLYGICSWRAQGRAQRLTAVGGVLASLSVTFAAWRLSGDVLGAKGHTVDLAGAIRDAQGFEFVNTLLNITWYDPPVTLNYLTWAVFGPFSWTGLIVPVLATVALAAVVVRKRPDVKEPAKARLVRRTAVVFAIIVCLMPWGIQNPSELTYINFRLIALAFALLVPLVPADWFATTWRRRVLVAYCGVLFVHFAARAYAFGAEAREPLSLMEKADHDGVLLTVVFHNRSDYFGKGFRLTHFLPMYFTVLDGGINSQFWARYTEHLPIDYLAGKRPAQSDDWSPQNFDATKHLRDARWVLMQGATNDDSPRLRGDSKRAQAALESHTDRVGCEGMWCLYRTHNP